MSIFVTGILSIILILMSFWMFFEEGSIISPLPSYLSFSKNNQVRSLGLWLPQLSAYESKDLRPTISGVSGLIYNLTLDKMHFVKNSNQKLPMASLTKLMTAIIAIENKREDDRYVVRQEYLLGENTMGLTRGEILSLEELLYGLLLPSGNDAAETIAGNFRDGRNAFVAAMNDKVKSLGLANTQFTGPSGLEDDVNQYTTAEDMLVIARYILDYHPEFIAITSTFQYEIPQKAYHKYYFLQNLTSLISTYPGVKGIKSGYTDEAGYCLVTYIEHDGYKIVGIVLGSSSAREDMKTLLDYSLESIGIEPPLHQ